jgi:hypothetical protein
MLLDGNPKLYSCRMALANHYVLHGFVCASSGCGARYLCASAFLRGATFRHTLVDTLIGADGPEAVNGERLSARVLHQTDELTGGEIVRGDGSALLGRAGAGKLPDEQVVTVVAEVEGARATPQGALSQSPWSRRLRS